MNEDLLRFQTGLKVLCADTETEGLNLFSSKSWQYGSSTSFVGSEPHHTENRFLWWDDLNVGKDAARVTRFDYNSYKAKAEDPHLVYATIEKEFEEADLIIGHNLLAFDFSMFKGIARLLGKKWNQNHKYKTIDTLALSRAVKMGIPFNRKEDDLFWWQMKMIATKPPRGTKCSLGAMAAHYNLEYMADAYAHDASYDCSVNIKVFNRIIYEIEI